MLVHRQETPAKDLQQLLPNQRKRCILSGALRRACRAVRPDVQARAEALQHAIGTHSSAVRFTKLPPPRKVGAVGRRVAATRQLRSLC